MPYARPHFTVLNPAMEAIQATSASKGSPFLMETSDGSLRMIATSTAYEADE